MKKQMFRSFFFVVMFFYAFLCYAGSSDTDSMPLIYNQHALMKRLKGKDKKEVIKVLGNPTVRKPCRECYDNLEYWWYYFPKAGVFVHFKDNRVYMIRVLTEDTRSREL